MKLFLKVLRIIFLKVTRVLNIAKIRMRPVVLLVKKGTFKKSGILYKDPQLYPMLREEALEIILNGFDENTIIVSTTGKTSKEIYEIRERKNQSHKQDFLTVGSMGHCSSIATGIALAKPNRKVVCIDGDGSLIMHLGNLTTLASLSLKNFYHILLNNEVHESVGGQETAAKYLNLSKIVKSFGTSEMFKAETNKDLVISIQNSYTLQDHHFLR